MSVDVREFDVVVVGHGIAGMSAAVSAMESGAKVAVLERAPFEEYGGNTRYTEAFLRLKNENELFDDFESLLAEVGSANPDPVLVHATTQPYEQWPGIVRSNDVTDADLIQTFASSVVPTIDWLKTFGVNFIPAYLAHVTCREDPPLLAPSGGGIALIEALHAACEKGDVEIFYETTARRLIQDDSDAVVGVRAVGRRNKRIDVMGRAVVLACGGFEGNREMLQRYMGASAINTRPVARGGNYNKGEGIRMALDIGAAPAGDYGGYHANPVDPRSGQPEAKVLIFPFGVLVNKKGQRFTDEGPGADHRIYDGVCHEIQDQPQGKAFLIMDDRINDIEEYARSIFTDQPPVEAQSFDEIAEQFDLPVDSLKKTMADYNAACRDGSFEPTHEDGLATDGVVPPKSNWARPVDRPPFLCYPLISAPILTFGGVKVNTKAQVVNTDGEVIPGLYAAGEVIGLYYRQYAAATSVLRGMVFGRIAGQDAAQVQAP